MNGYSSNPYGSMYGQQLQQAARDAVDARGGNMFWKGLKRIGSGLAGVTEESQSAKDQRRNLDETGLASNQFAEYNQGGYQALTEEARAQREALRRLASGQDSYSREQLRQGMQQSLAAQQAMAAGARPGNAAMAARNAAMNMNRSAYGMSGQAALAGIQERRAAQEALNQMILQQRQQDLQGALGSRGNAISAYGGIKPEGTKLEQIMPLINAGVGLAGAGLK